MNGIDARLTPEQRRAILTRLDAVQQQERPEADRRSSLPTCVHCWDGSHRVAIPACWARETTS
jgi:hypothetical protein